MGEAILNKENYNIEMNFNSSSNVNSALTINSLKLYKDINKPNKNSEQKKKKDDNREDRN